MWKPQCECENMSSSSSNKFASAKRVHTEFINRLSDKELITYVEQQEYEMI
jgi:hypothetical protein